MVDGNANSQLVVVGSSAGGIEALSTLVSTLPADFPAPIVLAQHLDPKRPSYLAEILSRHSTLPVRTVVDHAALEPGIVFVVPANRHVEITDHDISLTTVDGNGPKPSIDRLFRSAAETFAEGLIAAILTGTGSDGASGAREVKRFGGTVIIQNPQTAAYSGMPQSLAPNTVDIVADLERIGPLIHNLLTGAEEPPTRSTEAQSLNSFLEQVREYSDIDFGSYKQGTILRRLHRRMVATDAESLSEYLAYLRQHPEEYRRLVSSFLIKVTEFLRDPELVNLLREQILPKLIEQSRSSGNELRVWSAGCATGEEAYSLAILLSEVLGTDIQHFDVRIFATDLDSDAVAFARHGIYPPSALSGLSEDLISRYFNRVGSDYQVKKQARTAVIFGQHDLGQRAPFPRIDLVLCRNVLIYFTPELQKRALELFAYSLRDEGFLVLGKAESLGQATQYFTPEEPNLKVYRRHGERIVMPAARFRGPVLAAAEQVESHERSGSSRQPPEQRMSLQERTYSEGLLFRLPVGVVVVDRDYNVEAINSLARRMLDIRSAATGEDFIHLLRGIAYAELRALLDATFATGEPSSIDEIALTDLTTGQPAFLQIRAAPMQPAEEGVPIRSVIITISDVTRAVAAYKELEQKLQAANTHAQTIEQGTSAELKRLQANAQALVSANHQLVDANEALAAANEQLRAANEELLLANEEMQSSSEEIETVNEEFQATNEEMETVNEELQATIEELNTTNDDLNARSTELRELARSLESQQLVTETERARLATILSSMYDAVLVVDNEGTAVLTNPAYERLLGEDSDHSAHKVLDADGHPLLPEATPQQQVMRGEAFSVELAIPGDDHPRRWLEVTGQPIIDGNGNRQGGVLVFRDITERSLHRLQDEFLAMVSHEMRTPMAPLQGYLQMLSRLLQGEIGERQRAQAAQYSSIALAQARQLSRRVDDLLDVVRLQTGKFAIEVEPMDLGPAVSQSVETAKAMTEKQRIELELPESPLTINGDRARLEQVVLNLLANAVRHAPDSERIVVRLRRSGGKAEIQVQDFGPGIPASKLPHLFSRFYQGSEAEPTLGGGLGLGLYICKEIVAAHGGTIAVESVEGDGATFTVRLPLSSPRRHNER